MRKIQSYIQLEFKTTMYLVFPFMWGGEEASYWACLDGEIEAQKS